MKPQRLKAGRIVDYAMPNGTIRPAIVTAVHSPSSCDLEVFGTNDGAVDRFQHQVFQGDAPGNWQWPKRDDDAGAPSADLQLAGDAIAKAA